MKSAETYKIIRTVVAPWFKSHGFLRSKRGALCWNKKISEDEFFVIWFQTYPSYDWAAGGSFTMEFQLSTSAQMGAFGDLCVRHRLPNVMTDGELESVRIMQNKVRSKLIKPSRSHWIYQCRQGMIDHFLGKFEQIESWNQPNYKNLLWFQYKDGQDVNMWAEYILELMPCAIERMETLYGEQIGCSI